MKQLDFEFDPAFHRKLEAYNRTREAAADEPNVVDMMLRDHFWKSFNAKKNRLPFDRSADVLPFNQQPRRASR